MKSCDEKWQHLGLVLCLILTTCSAIQHDPGSHYVNSFVVRIDGDRNTADEIAESSGFRVKREVESLGVFELYHPDVAHRDKRSSDHIYRLQDHPSVLHVEQQEALVREKRQMMYDKQLEMPIRTLEDKSLYHRVQPDRMEKKGLDGSKKCESIFNDKYYHDQWELCNAGQTTDGKPGIDLNCVKAWENGFTGKGVVVSNLDDGIDHNHPDLIKNYDAKASADFNDKNDLENDPMPNDRNPDNSHGTRCAGIIAAEANNGICGVGVAFNCNIGGVRILDGTVTDLLEARALLFQLQYIDIISASWGPKDNGATLEAPRKNAREALRKGVTEGRGKKGRIYVWATGNGGLHKDDCNADGYVSSIETLSVGSITEKGKRPYFMEMCSSTLVVVPTGGEIIPHEDAGKHVIRAVTTDLHKGCTESFEGTSAAAPFAAGCVALALEANYELTWRDVQHIVVQTSRISNADGSWLINGAGFHISHKYGFGVMDCGRMVEVAQKWQNVPEQHICTSENQTETSVISRNGHIEQSLYLDGCKDDPQSRIDTLEHVQLRIKVGGGRRGNIQIFLTSPSGTKSQMLKPRENDHTRDTIDFIFMSVHHWGEDPRGKWILQIFDDSRDEKDEDRTKPGEQTLSHWSLITYGSTAHSVGARDQHTPGQRAWYPSHDDLEKMMTEEKERSVNVQIKRQGKLGKKREFKNLKSELYKTIDDLLSDQNLDSGPQNEKKRTHSDHNLRDKSEFTHPRHSGLDQNEKRHLYSQLASEMSKFLEEDENKLSKHDEWIAKRKHNNREGNEKLSREDYRVKKRKKFDKSTSKLSISENKQLLDIYRELRGYKRGLNL